MIRDQEFAVAVVDIAAFGVVVNSFDSDIIDAVAIVVEDDLQEEQSQQDYDGSEYDNDGQQEFSHFLFLLNR
ncbi:hypothetical protein HMPREF9073_02851 [Capnocytophaga sp. oral taxon 326 str. F0382]|nr:hypothetical protein HMPREF9073_02851 [Capnocytophaga sp. oral taxon 326 str. F0382]